MREEDVYLSLQYEAGRDFLYRKDHVCLAQILVDSGTTARYSLSLKTRMSEGCTTKRSPWRPGVPIRRTEQANPTLPSALVFSADADHRRSNLPPPCNRKGLCFAGLQLPPGEEQQAVQKLSL